MSLRVRFDGLREFQDFLREAPVKLGRRLDSLVEKVAREVYESSRRRVHVVSGRLRESIGFRRAGPLRFRVEVSAPYAVFEEAKGGSHRFMGPSVEEAESRLKSRLRGLNLR